MRRAGRPGRPRPERRPAGDAGGPRVPDETEPAFSNAGDGNLHPNFIFDRDDPRAEELTETVRNEIFSAALAMGGTVTSEHGIGISRREALVDQVGTDVIDVMRSIKAALDPLNIMNPGRVFRA